MSTAAALLARAAPLCAAVALLAISAATPAHHGFGAHAQGAPVIELARAGVTAQQPLVALHASPEPAVFEVHVTDYTAPSLRVLRAVAWGGHAEPPTAELAPGHGVYPARLTVGREAPGELLVEISAPGAGAPARELYVVRVLDALPPEGSRDRAPPSYIVGNVGAGDPARPRILAQASLPLCADTPHVGDDTGSFIDPSLTRVSWDVHPTMSGIPPIEGVAVQDAKIGSPADGGASAHPEWWGCYTRASFGTQVSQWMYVCDVPGSDRVRYYARQMDTGGPSASALLVNPYNGDLTRFSTLLPVPRAAAPGPHWATASIGQDPGYPPPGFDPHATIPPDTAGPPVELFLSTPGSHHSIRVAMKGTLSFVPELLPLDGRLVIRATAFHSDDVTFRVAQEPGALLEAPGLPATVNGTLVPVEPGSEPHYHDSDERRRHSQRGEYPEEPHYDRPPDLLVRVSVSEVALRNGILVEGITDGGDTGGMEVKKLHGVTLVAEIPVLVPNRDDYALVDPEFAIAPWECWPRLNHSEACLAGEWPEPEPWWECPARPGGAAWVP